MCDFISGFSTLVSRLYFPYITGFLTKFALEIKLSVQAKESFQEDQVA